MSAVIERIKERACLVRNELTMFGCRLASGDVTCLTRTDRIVIVLSVFIGIMLFIANPAFAAGDLFDKINSVTKEYYGKLVGLSTFVAGLACVICLIWITISPTANGARTPLEWLKRIIIGYICIMLIGSIFRLIQEVTDKDTALPS